MNSASGTPCVTTDEFFVLAAPYIPSCPVPSRPLVPPHSSSSSPELICFARLVHLTVSLKKKKSLSISKQGNSPGLAHECFPVIYCLFPPQKATNVLEVLHQHHVPTVPTVPKHLNKIILSKGKKKIWYWLLFWVLFWGKRGTFIWVQHSQGGWLYKHFRPSRENSSKAAGPERSAESAKKNKEKLIYSKMTELCSLRMTSVYQVMQWFTNSAIIMSIGNVEIHAKATCVLKLVSN